MSAGTSGQELLIQLETALHRLVESFWEEPYRYFTESDAVTALQSWVARRPGLAQVYNTQDGFETGLLHQQYPTFFRLSDTEPTERKESPSPRGYYDLVLLNPTYVQRQEAETTHNRDISRQGNLMSPPLLAAVEFKLFTQTWKPKRDAEVRQELGKLRLALESPADATAAYMCVFCRDARSEPEDTEEYRLAADELLAKFPDIGFVLAASWPKHQGESFVHYCGPWITGDIAIS
jgi:hypothetical protein